MLKRFCDNCGAEITRSVAENRIVKRFNQFTLELLVTFKGVANTGDLCEACALKILSSGNDVSTAITADQNGSVSP